MTWKKRLAQRLRLPIRGSVFRLYAPRRSFPERAANTPQRVLIANLLPSLGDTIGYLALADVLADARPDVEIVWLANSALGDLVGRHPAVAEVLTITVPRSGLGSVPTVRNYYGLWKTARAILKVKIRTGFDIIVLPRGGVDPVFSTHAAWMLNAPRIVGYSHAVEPDDPDHNFSECLMTDVIDHAEESLEVMRALKTLEYAGLVADVRSWWDDRQPIRGIQQIAATIDAGPLMGRIGLSVGTRFAVISPGAGVPKRMWPAEFFRAIAQRLVQTADMHVLVLGTAAEWQLCEAVTSGLGNRVRNEAGSLNLPEIMAVLSHAQLFIGNDSGTGHIAGALGIPVVSIHVQAHTLDRRSIRPPEQSRPAGPHVTVVVPKKKPSSTTNENENAVEDTRYSIGPDEVWSVIQSQIS